MNRTGQTRRVRARSSGTVTPFQPPTRLTKGRIVVTGGAGFLGSNLVDALAAEGHEVLIVDSLARRRVGENLEWLLSRHPAKISVEKADVRDPAVMQDAVVNAAAVIHLAAQVAVTSSIVDPVEDFEINARGSLNVLEAVRTKAPQAAVIMASTNKVYGEFISRSDVARHDCRYAPVDPRHAAGVGERMPLSFHSPYGCSKGVADQYVLDYARIYRIRTVVFRMSCLYGPHQFGTEDQGWVAHFLIAALSGQPITIYGDGLQVRDLLYVDDAVAAYRLALRRIGKLTGRVFNLGGGPANALSLRELLVLLPRLTGIMPHLDFADWRPGDQPWYVSDTSAFERATGWRAKVAAEDGLARLADWLAENLKPAADAGRREVRAQA